MSEIPAEPIPKRHGFLKLQNALWLIAVIAVWYSLYLKNHDVKRLKSRIALLQPLARELVVDDPTKFAVVFRQPSWMDENQWEIHVPPGAFNLCLATHDVVFDQIPEKLEKSAPLEPGRHLIKLDHVKTPTGWRLSLMCDGTEILTANETAEWYGTGSSQGGSLHSSSQQVAADQPVTLFHRQYVPDYRNTATGNGIVLWIEPAKN